MISYTNYGMCNVPCILYTKNTVKAYIFCRSTLTVRECNLGYTHSSVSNAYLIFIFSRIFGQLFGVMQGKCATLSVGEQQLGLLPPEGAREHHLNYNQWQLTACVQGTAVFSLFRSILKVQCQNWSTPRGHFGALQSRPGAHDVTIVPRKTRRNNIQDAQEEVDSLASSAKQAGLVISRDTTAVFNQNIQRTQKLQVNGAELCFGDDFKYLGSSVSGSLADLKQQSGKVWGAFWSLEKFWKVIADVKLKIFLFNVALWVPCVIPQMSSEHCF